uniref:Uncharacterized protein n=1 Tax=Echinococcus canadensis TaxID=519352 RepID=A0A915EWX3_9CEST
MCTKRNTTIHFLSHTEKALAVKTLTSGFDHNRSWRPFEIRAYILLLALTLFVVAVSADALMQKLFFFRDGSSRDVVERIKERLECIYKFIQEDALLVPITNCIFFRFKSMMVTREQVKCVVPRHRKPP